MARFVTNAHPKIRAGCMSDLEILPIGTPSLRQRTSPVVTLDDQALHAGAERLLSQLYLFQEQWGFGRAIAAPQIGLQQRMIALRLRGWPSIILNPLIIWEDSAGMTLWDDCMCFPQLLVRVRRARSVSVRFVTLEGLVEERECLEPAQAELLQHEIDHLDGILAVDRAVGFDPIISKSAFGADPDYFRSTVDFAPR
jgi:peptide deformylase